jgi:hypothetical protein
MKTGTLRNLSQGIRRLERVRERTDSVRVISHAKGYRSPVPCALSAWLTRVLCGHQRTICVRSI